ncbi:hypothetical protein K438DRAFT_1934172 [Mycena galopus ATCC 62051]|nr:hypothetical protein K438DRAFT_1934172 [Mycena galopus ATCC 62051]
MSRNPPPRSATPQRPEIIFVIYRMMNNIVVSLLRSCDGVVGSAPNGTSQTLLHASEKAVVVYCHLFHFVISLIERKWSESLVAPFLEEVLIRNARWVLKDAPHLEVLEHGSSDYRLAKTFDRPKTSLWLVMFQITFLELFYKAYGHGYGDIARWTTTTVFLKEAKQIYEIDTWPAFFEKVRYPHGAALGNRDVVETSAARHDHKAASSSRLNLPRDQRRGEEETARRILKTKEEEEEVFRPFWYCICSSPVAFLVAPGPSVCVRRHKF